MYLMRFSIRCWFTSSRLSSPLNRLPQGMSAVRWGRQVLFSQGYTLHARRRERATILLRKRSQVRWWHPPCRRHAPVALAVAAVTRRAVELEQVVARD